MVTAFDYKAQLYFSFKHTAQWFCDYYQDIPGYLLQSNTILDFNISIKDYFITEARKIDTAVELPHLISSLRLLMERGIRELSPIYEKSSGHYVPSDSRAKERYNAVFCRYAVICLYCWLIICGLHDDMDDRQILMEEVYGVLTLPNFNADYSDIIKRIEISQEAAYQVVLAHV
jgi:hypothetical protein